MNLLGQAEADLAFVLEDDVNGYGRAITLTAPGEGGTVYNVKGQYNRIGVAVDPGTGAAVATDKSSVTVRISSLSNVIPGAGWTVTTTDSTGAVVTGKVPLTGDNVFPDRALGRVTILFKVAD